MNSIPIFDSLTHPTLDSNWILPKYQNVAHVDTLLSQMNENNISKALAVGMLGIGGFEEKEYISIISQHEERLVPICFFDLHPDFRSADIRSRLSGIKNIGYKGIKLHPRISKFNLSNKFLKPIISEANDLGLSVLLCTYFYGKGINHEFNYFDQLIALVHKLNGAKLLLLHGGTVEILKLAESLRSFEHIMLDLSFTICKYSGSSLDFDIKYLFESFDQRICIGSDFPEFSLKFLRDRFNHFSLNLSYEKALNIGYNNLNNFINLA